MYSMNMTEDSVNGRGRGWISWIKSQKLPGFEVYPVPSNIMDNLYSPSTSYDHEFVDASEYTDVVAGIKELNEDDDAVRFNKKMENILEIWKKICRTGEEVEKSFDSIYKLCLGDGELASKLVLMTASRTAMSQDIYDKNIRYLLVLQLQDSSTDLSKQKTNPVVFRNSVRMLGEFYYRARLTIDSEILAFLVIPLITYLKMLLASASSDDLQVFAKQIFLNGHSIKSAYPEKLAELLIDVRLKLVCDATLTKECKILLLMVTDVSNSTFGFLPNVKFYLKHLKLTASTNIQETPITSSLVIRKNSFHEKNKIEKNDLQICESSRQETIAPELFSKLDIDDSVNTGYSSSSGFSSDSSYQTLINASRRAPRNPKKLDKSRVGVGARLLKYKQ